MHFALVLPTYVPEVDFMTVGHESKGAEILMRQFLDLFNVELGLGLCQARINAGSFGFNNSQDVPIFAIERVIADAFW